jgi:hypothetical protein
MDLFVVVDGDADRPYHEYHHHHHHGCMPMGMAWDAAFLPALYPVLSGALKRALEDSVSKGERAQWMSLSSHDAVDVVVAWPYHLFLLISLCWVVMLTVRIKIGTIVSQHHDCHNLRLTPWRDGGSGRTSDGLAPELLPARGPDFKRLARQLQRAENALQRLREDAW